MGGKGGGGRAVEIPVHPKLCNKDKEAGNVLLFEVCKIGGNPG